MEILFTLLAILFFGFIVVSILISMYKVVDPNEAHVVVFMGRGRKIYSPAMQTGGDGKVKTAYFYIPFLMRRFVLPLTNVKMEINDIRLNDKEVAPFVCDVIAWLHIDDPDVAAERLNLSQPFESLHDDLINVVQSTSRTTSMKQEVLDIMRDRQTFSSEVSKDVGHVLSKWGVELINLEINDIRDDQTKNSTVIADYENMRKAQVRSESRQKIATQDKEAVVVEQLNLEASEIAKAVAEERYTKQQIESAKNVGIEEQNKELSIAEARQKANLQHVKADREMKVGSAQVEKDATIEMATGQAEAVRIKGEKEAEVVKLKGVAEGKAIEAKGTAEAVAKDKMAVAMAKYNEAGTVIEKIRALIEIETVKYTALGKALEQADLKLVTSGQGANLLGLPLNAETGADLGQMLEGLDLSKISSLLGNSKEEPKQE